MGKQWLKCVFKNIYNRWIQCKIMNLEYFSSLGGHRLWHKVTEVPLLYTKTKYPSGLTPASVLTAVGTSLWRLHSVRLKLMSPSPVGICSFHQTLPTDSRRRWQNASPTVMMLSMEQTSVNDACRREAVSSPDEVSRAGPWAPSFLQVYNSKCSLAPQSAK